MSVAAWLAARMRSREAPARTVDTQMTQQAQRRLLHRELGVARSAVLHHAIEQLLGEEQLANVVRAGRQHHQQLGGVLARVGEARVARALEQRLDAAVRCILEAVLGLAVQDARHGLERLAAQSLALGCRRHDLQLAQDAALAQHALPYIRVGQVRDGARCHACHLGVLMLQEASNQWQHASLGQSHLKVAYHRHRVRHTAQAQRCALTLALTRTIRMNNIGDRGSEIDHYLGILLALQQRHELLGRACFSDLLAVGHCPIWARRRHSCESLAKALESLAVPRRTTTERKVTDRTRAVLAHRGAVLVREVLL